MEIKSTRGSRIFWTIVGLGLAGSFIAISIAGTFQRGGTPLLILFALFPIGLGIATFLNLGRPAWIRVDANDVTFVPPMGSPKVFPRSSVKSIVRIQSSRGGSTLEFRDEDNRRLLRFEQGFAKADMENLAQYLGAKFIWDRNWQNVVPAGASSEQARKALLAMLTPEQRAEMLKRFKKPDGGSQPS